MSDIILVGNGPSLLKNEFGSKIDGFDKVVRFNNFEVEGYEKHVGSKCSILARRACDDVKMWPEEMFEEVVCFVTYCKWTQGMMNVARHMRAYYKNKCTIVFPHTCASIGREMNLAQPNNEWASVGVLALGYFTRIYDKVTVCGFDHLVPENGKVEHYFPKPPKDDRFHNGEKERIFTESLIEQNKVIRLT